MVTAPQPVFPAVMCPVCGSFSRHYPERVTRQCHEHNGKRIDFVRIDLVPADPDAITALLNQPTREETI